MAKKGDRNGLVSFRDPKTGKTKTGRIVVKPGREQDAQDLRGMASAAAQAGWDAYQASRDS